MAHLGKPFRLMAPNCRRRFECLQVGLSRGVVRVHYFVISVGSGFRHWTQRMTWLAKVAKAVCQLCTALHRSDDARSKDPLLLSRKEFLKCSHDREGMKGFSFTQEQRLHDAQPHRRPTVPLFRVMRSRVL
jgi:hypothetical protein